MNTSVSIRDLSLSFGAVTVLKDLNLDIADGEFPGAAWLVWLWQIHAAQCIAGFGCVGRPYFSSRTKTSPGKSQKTGASHGVSVLRALSADDGEKNLSFGLQVAKMPKDESTSAWRGLPKFCKSARF